MAFLLRGQELVHRQREGRIPAADGPADEREVAVLVRAPAELRKALLFRHVQPAEPDAARAAGYTGRGSREDGRERTGDRRARAAAALCLPERAGHPGQRCRLGFPRPLRRAGVRVRPAAGPVRGRGRGA